MPSIESAGFVGLPSVSAIRPCEAFSSAGSFLEALID